MGMQLVFIGTIALCLVVSSAVLEQFEQAPKQDGSLSFLVIGDWGRKGAYNQSKVAFQVNYILFYQQILRLVVNFFCYWEDLKNLITPHEITRQPTHILVYECCALNIADQQQR